MHKESPVAYMGNRAFFACWHIVGRALANSCFPTAVQSPCKSMAIAC